MQGSFYSPVACATGHSGGTHGRSGATHVKQILKMEVSFAATVEIEKKGGPALLAEPAPGTHTSHLRLLGRGTEASGDLGRLANAAGTRGVSAALLPVLNIPPFSGLHSCFARYCLPQNICYQ